MKNELFIGIDMSKLSFDAAIIRENSANVIHRKFENNFLGFEKFKRWIEGCIIDPSCTLVCCLEHTGIYGLPLCSFLSKRNISYIVESPLRIKRSMGIVRGKSDKKDAAMIARYLFKNWDTLTPTHLPANSILSLRYLLSYRERLMKGKILFENAAKELQLYTEESIHTYVTGDSAEVVNNIKAKIVCIDKQILDVIKSDTEIYRIYKLVTSVIGIGTIISAYLIVYTSAFTLFPYWKKFATYCGITPFEYTSGTSIKGKSKINPIANKKLKALLSSAAWCAVQNDNELKFYFNRQIAAGKPKMSVINVVRNKLISRVFAAVKRGTPFVKINLHYS